MSISISPSEVTLTPGESVVFTATVLGAADKGVMWNSSGGQLVPSGLTAVFTAPPAVGEYVVTATSAQDHGRSASAVVTVEGAVDDDDAVSVVTDESGQATFESRDGDAQFVVQMRDEGGSPVSGVVVSFSQRSDGTPVFVVVDPAGRYAPAFVLGAPSATAASADGAVGVRVSPSSVIELIDLVLTVSSGTKTLVGSGLAVQEITAFAELDRVPCDAGDGAVCVCRSVSDIASVFHAQAVHDWRFGKHFMSAMVFVATTVAGVPHVGIAYSSLELIGVVPDALAADIIAHSGALGWAESLTPDDRLLVVLLDYQEVDVPERAPQAWSTMIISGEVCDPAFDGVYRPGSVSVVVDPPSPTYGEPVAIRVQVRDVEKANAGVVLSVRSGDHSFSRTMTAKPDVAGEVAFSIPSHYLAPISGKKFDDFVVAVGGTSLVAAGRYEWQGEPEGLGPLVLAFTAEPMVADDAATIRFAAEVARHDARPITCELHLGLSGGAVEVWEGCISSSLTMRRTVTRSVSYPKGMFIARFVVRDADGGYDSLQLPISVGRPGDRNTPPVVTDFHWYPPQPVAGEEVRFMWRAYDANGDIAHCSFNPGDRDFGFDLSLHQCLGLSASQFAYFPNTYASPGEFTASLRVRDGSGAETFVSRPVRVLGRGTLDVVIGGLPDELDGHVVVQGPLGFLERLERTTRLTVPAGEYEVTAWPVVDVAEVVYEPSPVTQQALVTHGGVVVATVDYAASAEPSVSVVVEPASVTLVPGQQQQFVATVAGVADTRVNWTPPSCGTITGSGNTVSFTAGSVATTCFLTATSVAQPNASGHAMITVSSTLGNVFVTVHNVNGLPAAGVTVALSGAGGSFSAVSGVDGVAEFLGVPAGDYAADVWLMYDEVGQFPLRDEYWGSRSVTVVAQASAAPSFTRDMPYMTDGLDFPPSVTVGTSVTVTNNVVNSGGRSVRGRLVLNRGDCAEAGCSTSGVAGSSTPGSSVGVMVTPTGTGEYRFYLALETSIDGVWRVTDQLAGFSFSFDVEDAQPPGTEVWTRQFGTAGGEVVHAVAVDGLGDVVIAGCVECDTGVSFGADRADAFVRKYDSEGNLIWARVFGTSASDIALGVAADHAGNVFVVGLTDGSLGAPNAGGTDAFVRMYNASGTVQWTRQIGTSGADLASSVAVNDHGHVFVAGYTSGDLGAVNAGNWDAFLRSYDLDGNVNWTRQFGTAAADYIYGVAVHALQYVVVSGTTFGSLSRDLVGSSDAFVRALSLGGDVLWTRQFGAGQDGARGVAVDGEGNVLVAGDTTGNLAAENAGHFDAYVRKFDSVGSVTWTRQFGTTGYDHASAVAADPGGNVLVVGSTTGALEGAGSGFDDAIVRKYDANGNVVWTRQFGPGEHDIAFGVGADVSSGVYVGGATMGARGGENAGGWDAYVRKYTP